MFRRILCPVDFSAPARAALRYAARLARQSRGQLTVLFVNDLLLTTAAASAYDPVAMERATAAEMKAFVRKTIGAAAGRVRYATAIGRPGDEIVKVARRMRADLIVVGTYGASGLSEMLVGSTTERVLRKTTTVPVLAVPARARP